MQTKNISWEAPEFHHHEKTNIWYICFGVLSLLLVAYAVYQKSPITIITFVLLALLALIYARKKPSLVRHAIGKRGVSVGDSVYPYKIIKTFWIVYHPPEIKTLNFETTAYLNRFITLQLGSQDPVEVKLALREYLIEDLDREESFEEKLARKLKF